MKPALVIEASPWQLTDEKTGEIRRGSTVRYIDFESPLDGRRHGFEPLKSTAVPTVVFPELPAFYDLRLRQKANKEGKTEVGIIGARLVGQFAPPEIPD
ncbi:MAG: hypothetical protein M3Y74_17980 [Chloroflexota bacterium]|nr:hypothetical protein [Chloroflexota bacterium]